LPGPNDDVDAAAGRATAKAAGVVVDGTAITPTYVSRLAAIVVGILLMAGGVYPCFEGAGISTAAGPTEAMGARTFRQWCRVPKPRSPATRHGCAVTTLLVEREPLDARAGQSGERNLGRLVGEQRDATRSYEQADDDEHHAVEDLLAEQRNDSGDHENDGEEPENECHGLLMPSGW